MILQNLYIRSIKFLLRNSTFFLLGTVAVFWLSSIKFYTSDITFSLTSTTFWLSSIKFDSKH